MLHHEVVDLLCIFIPPFLLIMSMVIFPLSFCCLDEVGWICWVVQEGNDWLLELANGQRSERTVELQVVCDRLEMASMLRLNVDAALVVPVLTKMVCSRPCIGAGNVVFLGVKEQRGLKPGVPLTLIFFLASAGWGVAIGFLMDVYSTNPNQWMQLLTKMLGLKQSHRHC